MTDIVHLSALELIDAYRARTLSPVEVLDAVTARAAAVEPVINAFSDVLTDTAVAAAREAEARYAGSGGGPPRALEGVPVAVKEEQPITGLPWRLGSLVTEGDVATETHPVVERVLAAGGVVHARTTTPEFSCAAFTHTKLWGVTRNPWNTDYGPGGSSGGAGASLAGGTAFLATGSDIGGSIRMPASLCGVVGFKPPYGRVPGMPPFNLDVYCHDGPLARTVGDCALLENVIAGPHLVDPVALPAIPPLPYAWDGVPDLRVALATTIGDYPVDPEVRANTERFGAALRDAGLKVTEVEVPISVETVHRAAMTHLGVIFGASMGPDGGTDPRLMPYTRHFVTSSAEVVAATGVFQGLVLESMVHAALAQVFVDHDVLICPTFACTGFLADDDYVEHGVTVDGVDVPFYLDASFTPIFNIASRHPVLNVPSGRAGNGVPTGVQIVGRPYDDPTVFAVGAVAETQLRWWADAAWRPELG